MSDKYIAKKYVTVGSVAHSMLKYPNCHYPMTRMPDNQFSCADVGNSKCKLRDVLFREVKSLTTIEQVTA